MSEEFSGSPVTTGKRTAIGAAALLLESPAVLRSFVEASLVFVSIYHCSYHMIFLQVILPLLPPHSPPAWTARAAPDRRGRSGESLETCDMSAIIWCSSDLLACSCSCGQGEVVCTALVTATAVKRDKADLPASDGVNFPDRNQQGGDALDIEQKTTEGPALFFSSPRAVRQTVQCMQAVVTTC